MMISYVLFTLLLTAHSESSERCLAKFPDADFKVQARWITNHAVNREIIIDAGGTLRDKIWSTDLFDLLRPDPLQVVSRRCLSTIEIASLVKELKRTGFMNLPSDVSSPPFYVDEPTAILEITSSGRYHRTAASGLDQATVSDALRFRKLWEFVLSLARKGRNSDSALNNRYSLASATIRTIGQEN